MSSAAISPLQHELFDGSACRVYADTANYGLPPRSTIGALTTALEAWSTGGADWATDWEGAGDDCRTIAAPILGAEVAEVVLVPAVSVAVGIVGTLLRSGDEIVVPDDEFRSMLVPLLAAAQLRGATVRSVPFDRLADEIGARTTLVATSHVRSQDGRVQDLDSLCAAARSRGAMVVVDATHSAGMLPINAAQRGIDFVVAAAYKHLLCPRGVAFMSLAARHLDRVAPIVSGWRSSANPLAHFYGGSLKELASTAARFDVSLGWHAWVGARESLRVLSEVGAEHREAWCVGLATRFAESLALEPTGSSVISVPLMRQEARGRLTANGIKVTVRETNVRVSFHLYNTVDDADLVAEALRA